ncbi:hypothetical protein BKA69DRAFT_1128295 [Paraphysoderma sedebokerense]|nr:hypothetical protein BKA69DRAFT_1128295 [Paraphysoderma sedebokerense]
MMGDVGIIFRIYPDVSLVARPTHKHNPSSGGMAPLPSSVGKATDSSAAKSDIRTDSPVFNVHILRDSLLGSWCPGKFVILTDLKVVTLTSDDCTSLVAAIPLSEAEITLKDTGGKSSSVESQNELPYKRLVIKFQRTSYVVEGKSDAVVQACYDTKAIPVTASKRSGNQTSSKMFSLKTGSVGNPIEPNI